MSAHAVNKQICALNWRFSSGVAIVCIQNLENVRSVTYPLFSLTPNYFLVSLLVHIYGDWLACSIPVPFVDLYIY